MKSTFAKFVDYTVGSALVFFAAVAVLRYYTDLTTSMFCAAVATLAALGALRFRSKNKQTAERLSKAADGMFYDFMFLGDGVPAKLLAKALGARGKIATVHRDAVYVGSTAAFFAFDAPPDKKALARIVARAEHYGASKAVVFCKTPPRDTLRVKDFEFETVCGDDVYKLFASLGATPEKKFEKPAKPRFAAVRAALGKDKIVRYAALSASLFFIYYFTRSLTAAICAAVCAALAVAASIASAVHKKKRG